MTTNPTDALDLTGLSPEQLDERLAQIEAARVAARAEAEARAAAHESRWQAARMTWWRDLLDRWGDLDAAVEHEVRAHRTEFVEAARAADLSAAVAAWRAGLVANMFRRLAWVDYVNARGGLDVDPDVDPMPAPPPEAWAQDFWQEFITQAGNGMGPDAQARYLAEFGGEPQFADYAAPAAT